jgi:hypothetical protein
MLSSTAYSWVLAQTSSCPNYSPYKFSSTSCALSFMPCRLTENGFKVVSEDVLSYLCTLAMQKCGKKSEKKRAACGGAAMRKRLLIKNFVAQMLQQDRPLVYYDEGLDLHYGKTENNSDEHDEESEKYHQQEHQKGFDYHNKVEQGHCGGGKPNKKGSLSDDSESDEEEVEDEEDQDDGEEDEHEAASDDEEEDEDYDDPSLYDVNGTSALSMVHRQTDISHYGDSTNLFYSTDDSHRTIQTTPLPSASTLCSGNSSMEIWGDETSDSYSLLSLNSTQSRTFNNDPMMTGQDENLFYSTSYQNSYMMSAGTTENHQNQVSLGGYMTVDQSNVGVNDGFIEDVTLCDKLDKLNDNFVVSTDDEVSLSNGTSFTSLVNMNSPVKLGNQSFDDPNLLLAYRRSITDLDTNTVVEEDDFSTDDSTTTTILNNNAVRSPKKRPHSFAQDDFYNLTLSSSPKRLKL